MIGHKEAVLPFSRCQAQVKGIILEKEKGKANYHQILKHFFPSSSGNDQTKRGGSQIINHTAKDIIFIQLTEALLPALESNFLFPNKPVHLGRDSATSLRVYTSSQCAHLEGERE